MADNARGFSITNFKNVSRGQAKYMQWFVKQRGYTFSTYAGWITPPDAVPLNNVPDPNEYFLRPVYLFNPCVDANCKVPIPCVTQHAVWGHGRDSQRQPTTANDTRRQPTTPNDTQRHPTTANDSQRQTDTNGWNDGVHP